MKWIKVTHNPSIKPKVRITYFLLFVLARLMKRDINSFKKSEMKNMGYHNRAAQWRSYAPLER